MAEEKKHFWETLPGIFTSLAALVTAIGGVIALFIRPAMMNKTEASAPVEVTAPSAVTKPSRTTTARLPTIPTREKNVVESVPEQRVRKVVMVSGVWRDVMLGTQVRVSQNGSRVTSKTINPITGQLLASGEGTIEGRTLLGTNRWTDGTVVTSRLNVSEDGNTITGTYRDAYTGQTGDVHLTR